MLSGFQPPLIGRGGDVEITTLSIQGLGIMSMMYGALNPSSNNWIAANVGVFVPFTIPEATTITKLYWVNGSAVAGNIDVGIFKEDGTRLVSAGSTAQASISTLQVVDITDTTLGRGRYYLGMTSDTSGITQKVYASLSLVAGVCQSLGILQDTACAPPLSTSANPATFVAYNLAFVPLIGAQGYRAIGP